MKQDWKNMNFTFVPYKDTKLSVLASPDDIQVLLEDHIVKTTTMKGSPFIGPFEEEVNQWDITLVCFHLVRNCNCGISEPKTLMTLCFHFPLDND